MWPVSAAAYPRAFRRIGAIASGLAMLCCRLNQGSARSPAVQIVVQTSGKGQKKLAANLDVERCPRAKSQTATRFAPLPPAPHLTQNDRALARPPTLFVLGLALRFLGAALFRRHFASSVGAPRRETCVRGGRFEYASGPGGVLAGLVRALAEAGSHCLAFAIRSCYSSKARMTTCPFPSRRSSCGESLAPLQSIPGFACSCILQTPLTFLGWATSKLPPRDRSEEMLSIARGAAPGGDSSLLRCVRCLTPR